jgi:hypothetical protein
MSEVVLLLPNTDRLQQVEDYGRGCSTSTKYLTPFNKLNIMSEVVLLLLNTDRLQQVEYYGRGCSTSTKYLTPFNKLNIMSKVDEGQKLFTGSINQHLIEETAALNVSTK